MNAPHHDKLNRQTPPPAARQVGSAHPTAEIDLRLEWRDEGIFFRLSLYGRIVQAGCLTGAKHLLGLSLLNLAVADYRRSPRDLLADPLLRPDPRDDGGRDDGGRDDFGPDDGAGHA